MDAFAVVETKTETTVSSFRFSLTKFTSEVLQSSRKHTDLLQIPLTGPLPSTKLLQATLAHLQLSTTTTSTIYLLYITFNRTCCPMAFVLPSIFQREASRVGDKVEVREGSDKDQEGCPPRSLRVV